MTPVVRRIHCKRCGQPVDPNSTCACGQAHGKARHKANGYGTARWARIRALVIARDGRCMRCGSTVDLTAGHLRYPALTTSDAQCECRRCNSREGANRQHGNDAGGRQ